GDLEELGVLQRGKDRAADVARFLEQHRRRQIARRRIDGIAEHDKLDERDRDHGGQGEAVAAQLQKFLEQHGAGAAPEAAGSVRRERAHWKLSFAPAMRSMKTSSSVGAAGSQSSVGRWR